MASDSLHSSLSLEEDWGWGLCTDCDYDLGEDAGSFGPAAPRAQEEDTHSVFSESEHEESLDFTPFSNTSMPEEGALQSKSDMCNEVGLHGRTEILETEFGDERERDSISKSVGFLLEEDLNVSQFEENARSGRGNTDQTDQSEQEFESLPDSVIIQTENKSKIRTDFALSFQSNDILPSCLGVQTGNGCGYTDQTDQSPKSDSDSEGPEVRRPCHEYAISNPIQQVEPKMQDPSQNQEALQVCKFTPPLETVASETANGEAGNLTWSSFMVSEALIIETAGWREAVSEEQTLEPRSDKVEVRRYRSKQARTVRRTKMDPDHFDDNQSDSGVSADFSPNSTSDNETPIEREIRLAAVREQSLRRSRGLDQTKEFVEIPLRKPILTRDLPEKVAKDHGKERQFAGKKMEREISVEAEREKALVKLGRLPGFYDKGSVKQICEKKLLFETFQEAKDGQNAGAKPQESQNELEIIILNSNSVPSIKSLSKVQINNQEPKRIEPELANGNHFKETRGPNQNHDPEVFSSLKERKLLFESMKEPKQLQNSASGQKVNQNNLEKQVKVSPNIQTGSGQEPKSKEFTCIEIVNGNHFKETTNLPKEPNQNQDPQAVSSFKERKLLFESKNDLQISSNHNQESPRPSRERRKSMETFIQNLESTFKSMQETRDLQSSRNQDAKEHQRNQVTQVQSPKPCGPGLIEAKCQVIILESTPVPQTPEHTCKPITTTDSGSSRPPEPPQNAVAQKGHNEETTKQNPFFKLRSSTPGLPDVQRDIQEAKRREEELQKQRTCLYRDGSKVTMTPSRTESTHTDNNTQNPRTTAVCQSLGKLDMTWPPSTSQDGQKTQPEMKEQRQKNSLIQRWESGQINGYDANQD